MSDRPRLGIQLYTVRDLTGDDLFQSTLTALAALGFEGVEFAWRYGGMQPDELAAFLRSLDIACCGLHVQLEELLDPQHIVYDYARACGSPYITTSLCSRLEEWEDLLPQVSKAAAIARPKGLQFTYHNHWQEFARLGEDYALDVMRKQTDPDLVQFELDLGWIKKAGEEPLGYWQAYSGRVPQIHLRDYDIEQDVVCDIGCGFMDVAAVEQEARAMGTEWLIYEQDAYPVSPLASAEVCIRQCRAAGLLP
ncbi:MAG: sugar phosphate isomerase/epimerase [Armatimonadia bacterium]